jgi:hypothetical protein
VYVSERKEKREGGSLKLPEETRTAGVPFGSVPYVTPVSSSPQVSRHLSKLFDSLCKLKFRLDANQKPLKVGIGMYSKEDEYVHFDQECDLSGQVSRAWSLVTHGLPRWEPVPLLCLSRKHVGTSSSSLQQSFHICETNPEGTGRRGEEGREERDLLMLMAFFMTCQGDCTEGDRQCLTPIQGDELHCFGGLRAALGPSPLL